MSKYFYFSYILYKSPAFMLRNLLTLRNVHISVMTTPNTTTMHPVMTITFQSMIVVMSGSYFVSAYMPMPRTTRAMNADSSPRPPTS